MTPHGQNRKNKIFVSATALYGRLCNKVRAKDIAVFAVSRWFDCQNDCLVTLAMGVFAFPNALRRAVKGEKASAGLQITSQREKFCSVRHFEICLYTRQVNNTCTNNRKLLAIYHR